MKFIHLLLVCWPVVIPVVNKQGVTTVLEICLSISRDYRLVLLYPCDLGPEVLMATLQRLEYCISIVNIKDLHVSFDESVPLSQ
jgi:hypothetical protein